MTANPPKNIKEKLCIFLATGAYVGRSPFAPGTAGTALALPLFPALVAAGPLWGAAALVVGTALAVVISSVASKGLGEKDPSAIVIDEIVGFAFAVYLLPLTWTTLILAFIFFRVFDILKPFPADWADDNMEGGAGIVLDDVAAGIYANLAVHAVIWLFPAAAVGSASFGGI